LLTDRRTENQSYIQTNRQTHRDRQADKHTDKLQALRSLFGKDNETINYKLLNYILFLVRHRRTSVYWSTARCLVLLSNSHKQVVRHILRSSRLRRGLRHDRVRA